MNKPIIIPNVLYGQEVVLDREINNPNEVKIIVTTLIHGQIIKQFLRLNHI